MKKDFCVVTGAYGFTGKYITGMLIEKGINVRTLTGHPGRTDPFGGKVETRPFNFSSPAAMVEDLRGADTVYNTYWVRFNYGRTTFCQAVANVQNLIRSAAEAGVKRFVHISITNPDERSSSEYFRGKALMEKTLIASGLSYAIIRPTVLFGKEDILINNIAWLLRMFPLFAVPGPANYRIQPVHVRDVAALAVDMAGHGGNVITDAVGPETYSFEGLVLAIRDAIGVRTPVIRLPANVTYLLASMINPLVRDKVLTYAEIKKLMLDKLVSYGAPTCKTRFSLWLKEHADEVGTTYSSELKRHYLPQ